MAFDDLVKLTTGFIKGWKKGKLKEKLKETAELAIELKIKNAELEEKTRQVIDEIRRLKGEQPKPKIKPVTSKELEPKKKKKHKKNSKIDKIEIDEEVIIDIAEGLPKDAKFIGEREVIIQDIRFERRNICFKIQRYYSEIEGRTFEGEIPEGFKGFEFGPSLRSFVLYQYYQNRVPHRKIKSMLDDLGIRVSSGTISSILNKLDEEFEEDLDSAEKSALIKNNVGFLDETGAKFNGQAAYTFGFSNEYFTRYTTSLRKRKEDARAALGKEQERLKFLITDDGTNLQGLRKNHQLCWVHEIRKYKLCEVYKRIESETLEKLVNIWRKFYKSMKNYRINPSYKKRIAIEYEFDRITSLRTHVKPLDQQLKRTKKLKRKLLLFLRYPKLELNSNMIERDLRERVIKRKISLQNRSKEGMKAWDTMLSLASTCRKIELSFWDYLQDRVHKTETIHSLGRLIRAL